MQAKDLIAVLEAAAPLAYQESYDNSGLQVGDAATEVTNVLITLDVTEAVLQEAIARNCNMIIAHHPLIFGGLKRLTGSSYVQRIVQQAIKMDIVIYAIHTNLDNARAGVNAMIAGRLGLQHTAILSTMKGTLSKLYTYAPVAVANKVRDALFTAGAGDIGNYRECSFNAPGTGTFRPGANANPIIGQAGGAREWVDEVKVEVLVPKHLERKVLSALFESHPYENVAYELVALENANQELGAGIIGILPEPMDCNAFLSLLKQNMQTACVRHTAFLGKRIQKIAVCGGSGSFLLKDAINAGADVFVTADFKYHQFFDAEGKIVIADIGHYETEQFTMQLLERMLTEKFRNFAPLVSGINTNPVNYFC